LRCMLLKVDFCGAPVEPSTRDHMVKLLSPCVPYAQSLGAVALADHSDTVGLRLAHDRRFDQARNWAGENLASDSARLSKFLCELAMFADACGASATAQDLFLEALAKGDPSDTCFVRVHSAALAYGLVVMDGGFAWEVLARLPDGQEPSVTLLSPGAERPVFLPINVAPDFAEDLVANAIVAYVGQARTTRPGKADIEAFLEQLGRYLDAVKEDTDANAGATGAHSLGEIVLAVLAHRVLQAKRQKSEAEMVDALCDVDDYLRALGRPLRSYPKSLVVALKRLGVG
jgi:hypothetical protein